MALSNKQLKDVCCLRASSTQCRYLDDDFNDKNQKVFICKKLSPDRDIIDLSVLDFVNMARKSGNDPMLSGIPLGDNCQGYIVLKNKLQGYDIK